MERRVIVIKAFTTTRLIKFVKLVIHDARFVKIKPLNVIVAILMSTDYLAHLRIHVRALMVITRV